jgi:large subunit ribosomal protein L23
MALFDIFKKGLSRDKAGKKRKADEKLKRPSKGALKRAESPAAVSREGEKLTSQPVDTKGKGGVERISELAPRVILAPHVTEKTTFLSGQRVYVFRVIPKANKIAIKQAIKELYGIEPEKVSIANMPSKTRFSRGRAGVRPGYKKAMVYLKEGDKIEIA